MYFFETPCSLVYLERVGCGCRGRDGDRRRSGRSATDVKMKSKFERQVSTVEHVTSCYEQGRLLGDGNFAVVKECRHRETGREYAMKVIHKVKVAHKVGAAHSCRTRCVPTPTRAGLHGEGVPASRDRPRVRHEGHRQGQAGKQGVNVLVVKSVDFWIQK